MTRIWEESSRSPRRHAVKRCGGAIGRHHDFERPDREPRGRPKGVPMGAALNASMRERRRESALKSMSQCSTALSTFLSRRSSSTWRQPKSSSGSGKISDRAALDAFEVEDGHFVIAAGDDLFRFNGRPQGGEAGSHLLLRRALLPVRHFPVLRPNREIDFPVRSFPSARANPPKGMKYHGFVQSLEERRAPFCVWQGITGNNRRNALSPERPVGAQVTREKSATACTASRNSLSRRRRLRRSAGSSALTVT